MAESLLLCDDRDHVRTLTLNAPDRLNALSRAMIDALQGAFDDLMDDSNIRVVILAAAGRGFCAGHDLKEMTAARQAPDRGRAAFKTLFDSSSKMTQTIPRLPQPVIARVHGIATAAGCQLVASCDMALAAEGTRFGVNGVNIGLFCSTPMVSLSRAIPRKAAFEMLTSGRLIEAVEAERLGLINRCVPPDQLAAETDALADTVAAKLSSTVKVGKRAFYEQIEMSLADAYTHTSAVIAENMLHRDTEEGVNAFLEKRPPDWPG